MVINQIVSRLKGANTIAVMPHVFADGDGLGSSVALALALQQMGKQVKVYLEEEIPYIYEFLPGKQLTCIRNQITGCNDIKNIDVAVALDTGDMDRLGSRAEIFSSAATTINIDHHTTNSEFGFYNLVQTGSSAVGEIVYQLIKMMGQDLTLDIATCLYVAIATDTGGFRYSNTTPLTHQITADLLNSGVDVSQISQAVFETTTYSKVKLTGLAVNTLELQEKGKVALVTVTDRMLKEAGAKEEDCEGIVNLGRNIKGVEVAVMFRERSGGEIKVNFRSKAYVDVSAIAGLFSGGGHKRAAGCTVKGSMEKVKEMVLKDIREVL